MSASSDSTPVSIVHKSERDDVSVSSFLASSIVLLWMIIQETIAENLLTWMITCRTR